MLSNFFFYCLLEMSLNCQKRSRVWAFSRSCFTCQYYVGNLQCLEKHTQRNTISVRCKLYNVNAVADVEIVNSVPGPGIKFLIWKTFSGFVNTATVRSFYLQLGCACFDSTAAECVHFTLFFPCKLQKQTRRQWTDPFCKMANVQKTILSSRHLPLSLWRSSVGRILLPGDRSGHCWL